MFFAGQLLRWTVTLSHPQGDVPPLPGGSLTAYELFRLALRSSPGLGWNGRVGRQSRLLSGGSTTEEDGIFINSASSKLLERAHDILMSVTAHSDQKH